MSAPVPPTLAPLGRRRAEIVGARRAGRLRRARPPPTRTARRPTRASSTCSPLRSGGAEARTSAVPAARLLGACAATATARSTSCSRRRARAPSGSPSCGPGDGLWLARPARPRLRAAARGRRPLLVGGGVGTAPLAIWQDELGPAPQVPARLPRRRARRGRRADRRRRVATDDGSRGPRGPRHRSARAPSSGATTDAEVYACGPPPMLEAVRALCAERGVPAQLALESGMACGYGACFGCVVPTRDGYVRLCVDGPVLDAGDARRR